MKQIDVLPEHEQKWSLLHKIIFRFFAAYMLIYILPFPLSLVGEGWWQQLGQKFDPLINWAAQHIIHISYPITVKPNGSGDTTYSYVQEFLFVAVSLVVCIVWSILDRNRASYSKMLYWVEVLVRYYLAYILLSYAYSKIFKSQFPSPGLRRLQQPYGKSSPMGLAWTFLGFSTAFNYFLGFFEAVGGVLMLYRRTTLLGACIAATVITNIVLINFCYDVPVKLFSSNLLLMALFVIACDSGRFFNFFLFNKVVPPADHSVYFKKRPLRIVRVVLKSLVILSLGFMGYGHSERAKRYDDRLRRPPLYGVYSVQTFVYNNDTLPPLTTDSMRWSRLEITTTGAADLYKMNDSTARQICNIDTNDKTLVLASFKKHGQVFNVGYTKEGDDVLILRGTVNNGIGFEVKYDSVFIKMKKLDENQFLLMNRGFHWISERPFNR